MDYRGVRSDTQRKPCDNEHGRPLPMLNRKQPVNIRKRKFTGLARESDLPIVPIVFQGSITLGEGRGNTFIMFAKK